MPWLGGCLGTSTRHCSIICKRKVTKKPGCTCSAAKPKISAALARTDEAGGGWPQMFDDTIAAISTPLGEGGLAVVRLSGGGALAVADRAFKPVGKSSLQPSAALTHTIHYGKIIREDRVVDEVLLSVLRAPR